MSVGASDMTPVHSVFIQNCARFVILSPILLNSWHSFPNSTKYSYFLTKTPADFETKPISPALAITG